MATHEVTFPITDEAEILKLRAGDEVIVQGHIIGIRDRTQIRIFDQGVEPPLDLTGAFLLHTAPNVRKVGPGRYEKLCIGSIASSGKPPLPQIARTPYCEPSGSVKRTMRAEVVVPMQTFSYFPSSSLRTPGAVLRRNAPVRSIGGSTPWSKIRICVRSRIPMMCP